MLDVEDGPNSYSVKVVNPSKKSDYFIRKWRTSVRFQSVQQLRRSLCEELNDMLVGDHSELEIGYIEPGHGTRGKQRWIFDDKDLADMYQVYSKKGEIILWMFNSCGESSSSGRKRQRSPADGQPHSSKSQRTTKSDTHSKKLVEVEQIAEDLEEKHGGQFTREQYNVWAHMINMRKHESRDTPPDKPFFKGSQAKKKPTVNPSKSDPPIPAGISPGKRIHLRSECMEQLEKWHSLLEKGAICEEQYTEMQANILGDIKRF